MVNQGAARPLHFYKSIIKTRAARPQGRRDADKAARSQRYRQNFLLVVYLWSANIKSLTRKRKQKCNMLSSTTGLAYWMVNQSW